MCTPNRLEFRWDEVERKPNYQCGSCNDFYPEQSCKLCALCSIAACQTCEDTYFVSCVACCSYVCFACGGVDAKQRCRVCQEFLRDIYRKDYFHSLL